MGGLRCVGGLWVCPELTVCGDRPPARWALFLSAQRLLHAALAETMPTRRDDGSVEFVETYRAGIS